MEVNLSKPFSRFSWESLDEFIYLFQHELSQVPTERDELWQRLVDHAVYLNYPIFTDDYFQDYFRKK
jgi:hypothetical protein